jgi:hypothetical protein
MNTASESVDGWYCRASTPNAAFAAAGSSSTIPPPLGDDRAFANTLANRSGNTTREPRTFPHRCSDQSTTSEPGNGHPPNGHNTSRANAPANRPASNRPIALDSATTTRTRGRTSTENASIASNTLSADVPGSTTTVGLSTLTINRDTPTAHRARHGAKSNPSGPTHNPTGTLTAPRDGRGAAHCGSDNSVVRTDDSTDPRTRTQPCGANNPADSNRTSAANDTATEVRAANCRTRCCCATLNPAANTTWVPPARSAGNRPNNLATDSSN